MKNLTLTERDLERFANTARHSLALFVGQYALIRPKFPTVTDAAVEAMIASIKADPHGTGERPGIDNAVYFAAMYVMAARNLEGEVTVLTAHGNPVAVLHRAFGLVTACANSINALTLLSRGGLMPDLHLEERAPIIMATRNANKRHKEMEPVKEWVKIEWTLHGATAYKNNKSDFARAYRPLALQRFGKTVTEKTIRESWLK